MTNITYVVGEGFENFSKNLNVISVSTLEEIIGLPRIGKAKNGYYVFGQGVSGERIKKIRQFIEENKVNDIAIKNNAPVKEENEYVHKKIAENVMISKPLAVNNEFFISSLLIDDRCAEMSDHLTGQHVQGMALIEAARQMILSVSEHFFLSDDERFKSYFVLNKIDVEFKQFIFPIDVELRCTVVMYEKLSAGKFTAKCLIEFVQNNISCTEVTIQFMADEKENLEKKESKLANFSVKLAYSKEAENINHFFDQIVCINKN
ncbi:MAG: AfsA-related hotdog domain-containing protein [Gammaproteobacteria bacterium]|nr:AfsA-related hotdog domain-containing protein [Gammaproteobacteria bacterium]